MRCRRGEKVPSAIALKITLGVFRFQGIATGLGCGVALLLFGSTKVVPSDRFQPVARGAIFEGVGSGFSPLPVWVLHSHSRNDA
jgi:hypothetical protein